ncbi:hypothetical protein HK096_002776 [Nowakowskiella sp. JEL0078]|nr:hypothetical protein HK096_002776 [Nowakowskiella sp. JEL0078]
MAGIVGPIINLDLNSHQNLQTLRLVDCDVNDDLFEEVARKARKLQMIRIVFEDDMCEGIRVVAETLSDRTLNAFNGQPIMSKRQILNPTSMPLRSSGTLRIIALTRCANMSGQALSRLLAHNQTDVVDLHKHPDGKIGVIDDAFLSALAPQLERVKTLNIYGQSAITERCLNSLLENGRLRSVQGICVNNVEIGMDFFDRIAAGCCPDLRRLSVVDCPNVTTEMIMRLVAAISSIDGLERTVESSMPSASFSSDNDTELLEQVQESTLKVPEIALQNANLQTKDKLSPTDWGESNRHYYVSSSSVTHSSTDTDKNIYSEFLKKSKFKKPPLQQIYSLLPDLQEGPKIKLEDRWFIDESLDILSLWASAVNRLSGKGKVCV